MRSLIVSAAKTNSGKTQIASALIALLSDKKNLKVAAGKIGPDYIDGSFLTKLGAVTCYNFDFWSMRSCSCDWLMHELDNLADFLIVEGVMGLFDAPLGHISSTLTMSKRYNLPVLLVIDASSQAQSIAYVADGFINHCNRHDISVMGVLVNRVSSNRHLMILRQAFEDLSIPVLGYLPNDDKLVLPKRHLGLVQAGELEEFAIYKENLLSWFCDNTDYEKILSLMNISSIPSLSHYDGALFFDTANHISIARDSAFSFLYPHLTSIWQQSGKRLSYFSPLAGELADASCDAIFLPGGYPELYASSLSANESFRADMRKSALMGKPIYGECGGYMVLGESITDSAGVGHKMLDLLPLRTDFRNSRLHLGYREIFDCPAHLSSHNCWRGHKFHYSNIDIFASKRTFLYNQVSDCSGISLPGTGLRSGSVYGSYIHLMDYV